MKIDSQNSITPDIEISKSQGIRLLDIGLFGPLMIMGALNKEPPPLMRLALLGIGIGTIIYNARNYVKNLDKKT